MPNNGLTSFLAAGKGSRGHVVISTGQRWGDEKRNRKNRRQKQEKETENRNKGCKNRKKLETKTGTGGD